MIKKLLQRLNYRTFVELAPNAASSTRLQKKLMMNQLGCGGGMGK